MARWQKPTFNDCLSEAFNAGLKISGMGTIPLNKICLFCGFMLGFVNFGFWFLAAALEFIYLWYMSSNPRFYKYVEAKKNEKIQIAHSQKMNEIVSSLSSDNQGRLRRLNINLAEITKLMNWSSDDTGGFANQSKQSTLNRLPSIFLKLLRTKQLISESLQRTKAHDISQEIRKLEKQLEVQNINPALEKSLRSNIEIHRKRLDNLQIATDNSQIVEMELQRIENQITLVREEIAIDSSPEGLSSNIDLINNAMGETQDWINSNSDFLRKLSGPELDDSELDSMPILNNITQ